jgi:hypothetical protein
MRRALPMAMLDLAPLRDALDLWGCMWEADERARFETAVMRSMTDEHPRETRLHALTLCHILGTPRLLAAASRAAAERAFPLDQLVTIEVESVPYYRLVQSAERLSGNVQAVEALVARALGGRDPQADRLLDWIDVRDLVTVARTTVDARLYAEVERRIARRGHYQRGRTRNLLGFEVRQSAASTAAH